MSLGLIGFGIVDNGVLIGGAVAGFSLEDRINKGLSHIPGYTIKTRVKGLSSTLLGAGISNAVSDFLGGLCVSWEMAVYTFLGCMIVVVACVPLIFKIEKETDTRFIDDWLEGKDLPYTDWNKVRRGDYDKKRQEEEKTNNKRGETWKR